MFRNARDRLNRYWYGSSAEGGQSLLSGPITNYQSLEVKVVGNEQLVTPEQKEDPANRALLKKNKKMLKEKKPFVDKVTYIRRAPRFIIDGALVLLASDFVYSVPFAYHAAQQSISDHVKNTIMPTWSQLSPFCLAGVEEEIKITAPEQCFCWFGNPCRAYHDLSIDTIEKYDVIEDYCGVTLENLNVECNGWGAPSFMFEFVDALNIKLMSGLSAILILSAAMLYLQYLMDKHYSNKCYLTDDECADLINFFKLEKGVSGNDFLFEDLSTYSTYLELFDLIEWSYNEVDEYNKHLADIEPCLDKHVSVVGCAKIILSYFDNDIDIRDKAKALGPIQLGVNDGVWQFNYHRFFKPAPDECLLDITADKKQHAQLELKM